MVVTSSRMHLGVPGCLLSVGRSPSSIIAALQQPSDVRSARTSTCMESDTHGPAFEQAAPNSCGGDAVPAGNSLGKAGLRQATVVSVAKQRVRTLS